MFDVNKFMKQLCDEISDSVNIDLDRICIDKTTQAAKNALLVNNIVTNEESDRLRFRTTFIDNEQLDINDKNPNVKLSKSLDIECSSPVELIEKVNNFLESCNLEDYFPND